MNNVVFRLIPCLLAGKQNKTKGMKEISQSQTQEERPHYMNAGYSKKSNAQNVNYLMQFSSHSEMR